MNSVRYCSSLSTSACCAARRSVTCSTACLERRQENHASATDMASIVNGSSSIWYLSWGTVIASIHSLSSNRLDRTKVSTVTTATTIRSLCTEDLMTLAGGA